MTQLTPIRGFTNTPVSKIICILSTIFALTLSVLRWKYYVNLSIDPFIIEYNQYWRLITYQLSVINESDYLLCIILWFHYKNLERFYGSKKYLTLISIFALYNSLVCIISMSIGQLVVNLLYFAVDTYIFNRDNVNVPIFRYRDTIFNNVIPGPLGIISSLYICYGSYIPVSYHFKILLTSPSTEEDNDQSVEATGSKQITLTNHFQIHILYIMLLLNNDFKSIIPCLVGLFIGKLHTNELLPGSKSWLLPSPVFQLFINPRKYTYKLIASFRTRLRRGYTSINTTETSPSPEIATDLHNNEEDTEEAIDEIRSNESRNEIRAETPVRPLGSQFLDTFRT